MALVVVAGVVGAVGVYLLAIRDGGSRSLADPATVELPPGPDDPGRVRDHLAGRGRPLVRLHAAVAEFVAGGDVGDADACAALARDELAAIAEPAELGALASDLTDGAAVDLFGDHLIVVMDYLGRCAAGEVADEDELRFSSVVVGRYLDEIGVER